MRDTDDQKGSRPKQRQRGMADSRPGRAAGSADSSA